jgi:ribonuclease HI
MAAPFRAAVDGGSRGNPGPAAWAVVVLDGRGGILERHAAAIGNATNNVAEYRALLEALALATEAGADSVEVLSDSELLVFQVQGRYRVRNAGLVPLHAEAVRRIASFPSFRIVHVPRENNREADRLVHRALNLAETAPPGETVRLRETADSSSIET